MKLLWKILTNIKTVIILIFTYPEVAPSFSVAPVTTPTFTTAPVSTTTSLSVTPVATPTASLTVAPVATAPSPTTATFAPVLPVPGSPPLGNNKDYDFYIVYHFAGVLLVVVKI